MGTLAQHQWELKPRLPTLRCLPARRIGWGGSQALGQRRSHLVAGDDPVMSCPRHSLEYLHGDACRDVVSVADGHRLVCRIVQDPNLGRSAGRPSVLMSQCDTGTPSRRCNSRVISRQRRGRPRCEAHLSSTPDREQAGASSSIVHGRRIRRTLRLLTLRRSMRANGRRSYECSESVAVLRRMAFAYSVIVACEPGETPCPGASKQIADSPLSTATSTTADIVVLSAPHPCSASTVGSSLPHTYTAATRGTPRPVRSGGHPVDTGRRRIAQVRGC